MAGSRPAGWRSRPRWPSIWLRPGPVWRRCAASPVRGKTSHETVYAITSLAAETAGAARLLELSREHWGIENKLHYVRDVTCREDQARTNAGHAPQVLAALRNATLTLLRRLGFKPVEGFEHFAEHRQAAIDTVSGKRTE